MYQSDHLRGRGAPSGVTRYGRRDQAATYGTAPFADARAIDAEVDAAFDDEAGAMHAERARLEGAAVSGA